VLTEMCRCPSRSEQTALLAGGTVQHIGERQTSLSCSCLHLGNYTNFYEDCIVAVDVQGHFTLD